MRRLALALTLCAATAATPRGQGDWRDDPQVAGAVEQLFEQYEPKFRRIAAGEAEPWPQATLQGYYAALLTFRSAAPREAWPAEVDFAELSDALHRFAAEHPELYDLAPLAAIDWNQSTVFELGGAFAEVGALLERNLARYPEAVPHRPLLLFLLGHYDRVAGRWDDALRRLDEAEAALAEVAGPGAADLAAQAEIHVALERGAVATELGLYEEAVPGVRAARALAAELGEPRLWADAVVEELNLAVALDDFHGLEEAALRAEEHPLWDALPDELRARVRLRLAVGRAERERAVPGTPREARALLAELVEEELLVGLDARHARTWLADLCLEEGDLDEAEALLAELAEATGASAGADGPDRLAVDRVVLEGRLALARGASPEALAERLAATERAFEAMLARRAATREREQGQSVLYERLRMQMTESLVELNLAVHGDAGPARALEQVARSQALGSLARALGADGAAATEAAVRAELVPAGGGLVLYLPAAVRSLALAVDRDGTEVFELASVYRLDPLRRALARALGRAVGAGADAGGDEVRASVEEPARRLGDELFPADLRDRMEDWESLVVVGLDALGYVPFELLPWDGGRLGAVKAVSYLPSLPVGLHLARTRAAPAGRRIAVVAAPDAPDGLDAPGATRPPGAEPVPFGADERRELLGACALEAVVHAGASATLACLGELDPERDLVLQVVAHGVRTEAAHRPQGLLLAGGVLTPERAETLAVPPVVVLTACGAWRGPQRRGDDGRAHLAGALLLAGARTLVVSYTAIDYRAGLRTMGAAYGGLTREGLSPARALAAARAAAGDGELTPFLVHAVGLADEPLLPPAPAGTAAADLGRTALWIGATAAAVLGGGALLALARRRRSASARAG